MNSSDYRVRRATLEDLNALTVLWQSMRFPVDELTPRITEFQVAVNTAGEVLGAIGIRVADRQGLVHSESFGDFSKADPLRPLIWERLQSIANNQGLLRLWTQEQAPFWSRSGLSAPDAETLKTLPPAWSERTGPWLTLRLREDAEHVASIDKQFEMYMMTERARTERSLQHGKILKVIATLVALAVLGLVIAGAIFLVKQNPQLGPR